METWFIIGFAVLSILALRGVRTATEADDQEGELTVAPGVLASPPLAGRVVTGDALSCQTALCRQIRRQGGDYLVTVKAN